jgi:hypothetical protein
MALHARRKGTNAALIYFPCCAWSLIEDLPKASSCFISISFFIILQCCLHFMIFSLMPRTESIPKLSSCVREPQRLRDVGGAPDEPTPWKSIASDHPTVPFSVDVNQRLVWCLGLFIPPPLTHLRLLDYVEVQRSSRHIEDHIQSIQVLNCSSID